MSSDPSSPPPPGPKSGRFSLRMAFLITLVIAVTAAVWGGLTRQGENRALFIFFAAAAPFGLLALLGLWQEIARFRRRR